MALKLVFFSEAFQALSQEITYHPALQEKLRWKENSNLDATDKMAVIAAHCGIILDGYYDLNDLEALAELCFKRLRAMRVEIIVSS